MEESFINGNKSASRSNIAMFYEAQLKKLKKLGIGKSTDNGVMVTQSLINRTDKRLQELKGKLFINKCSHCGEPI